VFDILAVRKRINSREGESFYSTLVIPAGIRNPMVAFLEALSGHNRRKSLNAQINAIKKRFFDGR
jgi:hypothetical protein